MARSHLGPEFRALIVLCKLQAHAGAHGKWIQRVDITALDTNVGSACGNSGVSVNVDQFGGSDKRVPPGFAPLGGSRLAIAVLMPVRIEFVGHAARLARVVSSSVGVSIDTLLDADGLGQPPELAHDTKA